MQVYISNRITRKRNSNDQIYTIRKRSLHAEGERKPMSSPGDHKIVSTYWNADKTRKSIIMDDPTQGLYVVLCHNGLRVDKIPCYEKSVHWAESVAENYVDEILNPK